MADVHLAPIVTIPVIEGITKDEIDSILSDDIEKIDAVLKIHPEYVNLICVINSVWTTPLREAIKNHRHDVFDLLIKYNVDIHMIINTRGYLEDAVMYDDIDMVIKLINLGINLNIPNENPPINTAISFENLNMLKHLICYGANVDAIRLTQLLYSRSDDMIEFIIDNIPYVALKDPLSPYILKRLMRNYPGKVTQFFIDNIDFEYTDSYGDTIMHKIVCQISYGDEYCNLMRRLLVLPGANPNVTNTIGETPLFQTIRSKNIDLFTVLMQDERTDFTITSGKTCSVIDHIIGHDMEQFLKVILDEIISTSRFELLKKKNKKGQTPYQRAVRLKRTRITKIFNEYGIFS